MEIETIAEYDKGGMQELNAILEASKRKISVLSNPENDAILQSEEWRKYVAAYPVWTGTLVAFRKDNKPFEEKVEFSGLTFNIPEKFQGESGVIACNHPDFILNGTTYTPGKSAKLLPFPEQDGWHLPDKEFGIPNGKESSEDDPAARKLWRRDEEDYTGLLVRWGGFDGDDRRDVDAVDRPSYRLGVLGVRGKFKVPKHVHEWTCKTCGVAKQ